ncbi:MAG: hypothetical protein JWL68_4190, partial [Actinomycetia bacterium]|nr:hypothetical protein [Actinomycetes bacterium]
PRAMGRGGTGVPPPRGRRLGTPGPLLPGRHLAGVARSPEASQPRVAGGRRLSRARGPAATGRIPGANRAIPVGTRDAARTRGADGNSLGATSDGRAMTAARTIHRCLTLGGAGAAALRVTSRPGQGTSTPTGVAGLLAGARPQRGQAGIARRPRRSRRRVAAGGTGLTIRGVRRPGRSWKAACCREPRPGRPGASSTVAATSWSQARMMIPGGTATPQATAGAGGAVCSAGAAVTPTRNPITTPKPGPPARTLRFARPGRSGARGAASPLRVGRWRRLAVRSRPVSQFRLAARSRRAVQLRRAGRFRPVAQLARVVRFRLAGRFRRAVQFRLAGRFRRAVRCHRGVRGCMAGRPRLALQSRPGGRTRVLT